MIEGMHSFLVHPAKHEESQPGISGTAIQPTGPLYGMLASVFERAPKECDIEIVFRPDDAGAPQNPCRDLLVAYVREPTVENGRLVAKCLQAVTTHRSGLGLLFLMKGTVGRDHTVVVSRFPADQGVIAQERARELSVEFIERVFMKSARAYKSALFASDSLERGFWDGRAVDRQISGARELSDYWIREFLRSELRTTGPAGTRRLAVALREAIAAAPDLDVRHELISATSIMRGQHGQSRTARQVVRQLGLSEAADSALEAAFTRPELMDEVFRFDRPEFERHVLYRAVQLDNGGLMIAEDARFREVFVREQLENVAENHVRYSTEGRVVDERLRKTK